MTAPNHSQHLDGRMRVLERRIWISALIVILGGWCFLAWNLHSGIRNEEAGMRSQSQRLTAALQLQVAQVLDTVDVALAGLASALADGDLSPEETERWLQSRAAALPPFLSLMVIDAGGLAVGSTIPGFGKGQSLAASDFYRAHVESGRNGLFIGGPLPGLLAGRRVFAASRGISGRDGLFRGVIAAAVDSAYFARIFDRFPQGPHGFVVLASTTGRRIVASSPQHETHFGRDVSASPLFAGLLEQGAGYFEAPAESDGLTRMISFARLDSAPLVVAVGQAREDILDRYRGKVWGHVLSGAGLMAMVLPLAWLLVRTQRRSLRAALAGRQAERALRESELRYRSIVEAMGEGVIFHDRDGRMVNANPAAERILGLCRDELLTRDLFDSRWQAIGEDGSPLPRDQFPAVQALRTGESIRERIMGLVHAEKGTRWIRVNSSPIHLEDDAAPDAAVSTFFDITEHRAASEHLNLMAKVFTNSNEAIVITNADNHIVAVNPAFTALTGYGLADVLGANPKILSAGHTPQEIYVAMWNAIRSQGRWEGELWDRRKNGEVYTKWLSISVVRDEAGRIANYIGSFVDITERKASEERVRFLAHHDPLTELPNRLSLNEKLQQALLYARRNHQLVALMLIDLDRFKAINDTLGHDVGDHLLVEVAKRLTAAMRESDIVARLGGDEFVVVLQNIGTPSDAAIVAAKILDTLSQPYVIHGQELRTSPSIGICLYPDDGKEIGDLLKSADVAMYHAKAKGRRNYQFFTAQMQEAALQRMTLEADLRRALERRQFLLHYQPQLDLRSGAVVGVEALLRWRHPERGMVAPLEFIPVAEETGLIGPLGDWILDEACRQLKEWHDAGLSHIRMSVNLSAQQFLDHGLAERIRARLDATGLRADSLDLEITESTSMHSPREAIEQMRTLVGHGVSLSIDDFGTGYSSLAYLKLFPIRSLKIDRSFVKDIESDPNDADICDVTVLLAHKLDLEVVAEGVETEAQLKFLLSIGCEKIQGYLVSKPLPAEEAERFIRERPAMTEFGTVDIWTTA